MHHLLPQWPLLQAPLQKLQTLRTHRDILTVLERVERSANACAVSHIHGDNPQGSKIHVRHKFQLGSVLEDVIQAASTLR